MSVATEEIPFSQFLQHSRDTLAKLERSPGQRLRLVRRDGEDLIIEQARRAEADDEALASVTTIIAVLLAGGREAMERAFPVAFPWMRFLPPADAAAFVPEFTDTAAACAPLGTLAPLAAVMAAWRATAAVHADPDLHAALTTPLDEADYGLVSRPGPT
jgi:hypothetical protein